MSETPAKTSSDAHTGFAGNNSEFFARGKALEEHDAILQARDEKTARLREARKSKEINDRAAATAGLIAKRAARG